MRLLLLLVAAAAFAALPPAFFSTASDATRFLRERLGVGSHEGPIADVGRTLADQLARGFDPAANEPADPLEDGLDDGSPEKPLLNAQRNDGTTAAAQRALEALRVAYETGIVSRTVRRTLQNLAREESGATLTIRVAILRARTDRAEYRGLVEALSRDILTAATAELLERNRTPGLAEVPAAEPQPPVERAPAQSSFAIPDDDGSSVPRWPWLLGATAAALGLAFHQLVRLRRRRGSRAWGLPASGMPDDDRFDAVAEVRPVRPGIHQSPPSED